MTAQTPVTRTVTVTAKDGVLGSILSIWTSDSPLDQERGGKWGAEAKQGYHLGLCEFRDSLFSDWPGIQAQSCCSGSRKEAGGAGTHRVSYNQGSENFSWRGSTIPPVPGSETGVGREGRVWRRKVLAYVEITVSPGKQRSSQPWLKARGWPCELREASMAPPNHGAAASEEGN